MERKNILIVSYLEAFFFADFYAEIPTYNASCKEKCAFWMICRKILYAEMSYEHILCKQKSTLEGNWNDIAFQALFARTIGSNKLCTHPQVGY